MPEQGSDRPDGPGGVLVTVGGYLLLLVLGALEALVGAFQYSRGFGPVPVAALAFALLTGVTSVLGAWGMRRALGGLLPAAGWVLASFVLAMGTSGGSVLITDTSAGKWFLYGGSACAAAGVVISFVRWRDRAS